LICLLEIEVPRHFLFSAVQPTQFSEEMHSVREHRQIFIKEIIK